MLPLVSVAHPERWKCHSPQYVKAMDASFPPDRWPAQEIVEPDDSVRFVLKDGTEIHQISPPPLVYDLHTGEPCGRLGPHGTILPLLQPTVETEVVPPGTEADVAQQDEQLRDGATEADAAQTVRSEVVPDK